MLEIKLSFNIIDLGYELEDQNDFDEIQGMEELEKIIYNYVQQEYDGEDYNLDLNIITGENKSICLIDDCKRCGNDLFNYIEEFVDFGKDKFWINGLGGSCEEENEEE